MCMLFRGGRVFGSSVMELGGKWQKGRGHGAVPCHIHVEWEAWQNAKLKK